MENSVNNKIKEIETLVQNIEAEIKSVKYNLFYERRLPKKVVNKIENEIEIKENMLKRFKSVLN